MWGRDKLMDEPRFVMEWDVPSEPPRFGYGLVIRADGTVPMDADLHSDHKAAIITHLIETGHAFEHTEDGDVKLKSGPLAPTPGE